MCDWSIKPMLRSSFFSALVALLATDTVFASDNGLPELTSVQVVSSLDGRLQTIRYWAPDAASTQPTTLFVFLHSWSSDGSQDNSKWQRQAVDRGWIYVHPDFRGANNSPQACGSKFARQDVLDSIDFAKKTFNVDSTRIYLAGVSGGGHMAMLMAGHHPDRFSGVSAWVGISDIGEWYRFHSKDGKPQKYAQMILKCFGEPPGHSPTIDADYVDRSPLFHLNRVNDLPVDIFAGVNDGHTGSVPVSQSLLAFNRIAAANQDTVIDQAEIQQLVKDRKLVAPKESDLEADTLLGRKIFLRRTSKNSRVTIFDGGHESLPDAACDWLDRHQRTTE